MLKNRTINLKVVEEVANALQDLNDHVVFVGGAVVSIYADDIGADDARPTKDVDISVQISSYGQMDQLREQLSPKGIYPAVNESVIYRYQLNDILIDFIPTEQTSLGPSNSWLKSGYPHQVKYNLYKKEINVLPVSYYLASKWEAFDGRGSGDKRTSHDFEDIIYVLDNNLNIVDSILSSDENVRKFIARRCKEILEDPYKEEVISCHINPFTADERTKFLIEKLRIITSKI